jgi:hypothetical protein
MNPIKQKWRHPYMFTGSILGEGVIPKILRVGVGVGWGGGVGGMVNIDFLKTISLTGGAGGGRVSIIRIFIRIFFSENYALFEYFLTEYSNNNFLLNKP